MAGSVAKFTKGDSMKSTRNITGMSRPGEPAKPRGATSSGMPGAIKTQADASDGGLTKGKGSVVASTGPRSIPSRKGPDRSSIMSADNARGSMDKSYHGTSTGKAGQPNKSFGPKAPPSRGTNTNKDGARKVPGGLGFANAKPKSQGMSSGSKGGGQRGTVESLAGKARFSKNMTGAKKSMMY